METGCHKQIFTIDITPFHAFNSKHYLCKSVVITIIYCTALTSLISLPVYPSRLSAIFVKLTSRATRFPERVTAKISARVAPGKKAERRGEREMG